MALWTDLVASFLFAVVFPSVSLVRNCVQESITLTTKINEYLQTNEEMQQIMNEGLDQSAIYHKIVDYAATWGKPNTHFEMDLLIGLYRHIKVWIDSCCNQSTISERSLDLDEQC